MKKIFALVFSVIMLFGAGITTFANYRGPVDGIEMKSGLNPVITLLDGNKFEYAIYARDMDDMTNGDFTVSYNENVSFVSFEETGNHDMCSFHDNGNEVKISFLYNDSNQEETVKMFVLTFSYTNEIIYPALKVTNLAGTFIGTVADVIILEKEITTNPDVPYEKITGDVDLNGEITAADARLALRKSAKLETLSDEQIKNADVNGDSLVTSTDARLILRFSAGIDKEL